MDLDDQVSLGNKKCKSLSINIIILSVKEKKNRCCMSGGGVG